MWFVDAINKNVITRLGGSVYWNVNLLSSMKTGLVKTLVIGMDRFGVISVVYLH